MQELKIGTKVATPYGKGTLVHIDADDCHLVSIPGHDGHTGAGVTVGFKYHEANCKWFNRNDLTAIEEPMQEFKFKVGDMVVGTSDRYSITCAGWKGVVTEISDEGMAVQGVGNSGGYSGNNSLYGQFVPLKPKYFKLYTKPIPDTVSVELSKEEFGHVLAVLGEISSTSGLYDLYSRLSDQYDEEFNGEFMSHPSGSFVDVDEPVTFLLD